MNIYKHDIYICIYIHFSLFVSILYNIDTVYIYAICMFCNTHIYIYVYKQPFLSLYVYAIQDTHICAHIYPFPSEFNTFQPGYVSYYSSLV